MLRTRIIPVLLLHNKSLVKTKKFNKFQYIGDPVNTARIFNELEVDELCILDILSTRFRREPNFNLISVLASECFMPLSYGGGITNFNQAKKLYETGFEKVIINSAAYCTPELITEITQTYGNQAVIVSLDVGRSVWGRKQLRSHGGKTRHSVTPIDWARKMEDRGAGELLLTSIIHEGTYGGFDCETISEICSAVDIPVIAHGGAGSLQDIRIAVDCGASAVALGSMVVFQKQGSGVLVNFPDPNALTKVLS